MIDRPEARRFELPLGDDMARIEHRWENGRLVLVHTEVPGSLAGQGVGSRLVRGALEIIRARGQPVEVRCPFIRAWLARHPKHADLVQG